MPRSVSVLNAIIASSIEVASNVPTPEELTAYADSVVTIVNALREEVGALPLAQNELLVHAALIHATDMGVKNFVSHRSSNGISVGGRLDVVGYSNWKYAGENIAAGFSSPESVVQAWQNSPGHNRNLLDRGFAEIGVAVYYDSADEHNVIIRSSGDIGGPYYWYIVLDLAIRVGRQAFMPAAAVRR